ncbi:MAG: hypothetical protein H0U70_02375 [Tatlockia sp.]|nr:hypothetical protein [Tatlockia sp.]
MFKKTLAAAVVITGFLANPVFAAHFFQKFNPNFSAKQNALSIQKRDASDKYTDFSGTWVGSCTGYSGTETIVVENTDSQFTVDGNELQMGSLITESFSNPSVTHILHLLLEWNQEHSNLLITGSYVNYAYSEKAQIKSFGYANGSVSLQNEHLVIEMNSHASDESDSTVCTYNRK